ncbi:DUF4189 domain-containing protein [Maritimibacter sp. UBA3975]|mgnify:CR=1 FL=1|uniref:DUF4189 domain-containing protein n=1 Tax=Maritimibacter sp. UBA3975 TaxID=1946833 RepID=UPI0025BF3E7F|nr:DUF4189 domain-containing protein [Maritimibacter sp. UBA3975]|tara:strand:+ start:15856 stop:16203 length:348 start_codon:yes stop_codon:yes gene_type:complete
MRTFLKIAAFLTVMLPGAAMAQLWGGVGIGPGGAHGWSYEWATQQQAYDAVAQGCEYDCTEIRTFRGTCGAMAQATNGGWGWATGSSRGAAEAAALSYCRQYGSGCRVAVWACSG